MDGPRPLLLLVASGASERGGSATTLSDARTPHLDRLAARGTVLRVRTTPDGLEPGTEVGLPTLLGIPLRATPSRGYLDAAALGQEPLDGTSAWRLDLHRRGVPWVPDDPRVAATLLTERIGAPVHHLREHRFALIGPRSWGDGPDRSRAASPRRTLAGRAWRRRLAAARAAFPGVDVVVWGRTSPVRWSPELPRRAVVVAIDGSPAVGVARAAGLEVAAIASGSGHALAEMAALARRATRELRAPDGPIVVVHSHHVDDAAHRRRRADKVALLGAFDLEVTGPTLAAARDAGAAVWWCPDVGTDPLTGAHLPDPVPSVWTTDVRGDVVRHLRPVTERSMRHAPMVDGRTLLASLLRMSDPHVA